MTTEVVHSPGGVNGASCGAPFTADIRFTAKPSKVTCPACLTAMGEPRVISGLDTAAATSEPAREAVPGHATNDFGDCQPWCQGCEWRTRRGLPTDWEPAAPPARPSRVEVGQRWKDAGPYTVLGPGELIVNEAAWVTRRDGDDEENLWLESSILADEYLGTVPAPVSAPAAKPTEKESPMKSKCCCDPRCVDAVEQGVDCPIHDGAAPGQSTPVETPLNSCTCDRHSHENECQCDPCGCKERGALPAPPEPTVRCQCPSCVESGAVHYTAAPAPGVGEGLRELTFAEAMALDPGEVEWTCDTLESHAWSPLAHFQHLSLGYLLRCRFRRRPEPLPAPAPRVSRAREMVDAAGQEAQPRRRELNEADS